MTETDLLTTVEAAAVLDKAVRTVQYYVQTGRLVPALQAPGVNGAYFFTRESVEALQASEAVAR